MPIAIHRRAFLSGALATPLAGLVPAWAEQGAVVPIADMHAHLFFIGPHPATRHPLRPAMAAGRVALASWSLVGDMPWLRQSEQGLRQKGAARPGQATEWFEKEVARIKAHLEEQNLKLVLTPADLDRALTGEPHVVLSVEGASFLDDGIEGLARAHAAGVRHLQLVHFVENRIGDFQTEAPRHNGLTPFGLDVVREANRLGILLDLAHCTGEAVQQALAASSAPLVWSHSSVTPDGRTRWTMGPTRARQIALQDARAIAAKGGVVGLWGLRSDIGPSVESYSDRLIEMAEWLGHDHVGFGTDMNALSGSPIATYRDLRRVVGSLQRRGLEPERIRRIAIDNYARVLRAAMTSAPT